MAPPSYARATTSSRLKTSLAASSPSHESAKADPTTPKKRLHRPSTLTSKQRQSISYNSTLYPIKPIHPDSPSPIALLPSELRTLIYQYILPSTVTCIPHSRLKNTCYVWPHILHICRAIRIEAAYEYYVHTPFSFAILNIDIAPTTRFINMLPRPHRALLSRNQHLTLRIDVQLRNAFRYAGRNWFLDAPVQQHWNVCAPWGNLYVLDTLAHRFQFSAFCRLMNLWQSAAGRCMRWRWEFDVGDSGRLWGWLKNTAADALWVFLSDVVGVLGKTCVERAWTRGRDVKGLKEEATAFLEALDEACRKVRDVADEDVKVGWDKGMRRVKGVVGRW